MGMGFKMNNEASEKHEKQGGEKKEEKTNQPKVQERAVAQNPRFGWLQPFTVE